MQDRKRPEGSHQQFVRIPFNIISLSFGILVRVIDSLLDFPVFYEDEGTFLQGNMESEGSTARRCSRIRNWSK